MHRTDLKRALLATLFFGAASGIFTATLNNYLAEVHHLSAEARGWLELPRELPGFLIMFVAGAMLTVFRETQMAAAAMVLTALGAVGLGYLAPTHATLVVFIVIWSLGDHIIFAVEGPIGLKLAEGGREGRRLGQFGGARNLGTILGVGVIYVLARFLGIDSRFSMPSRRGARSLRAYSTRDSRSDVETRPRGGLSTKRSIGSSTPSLPSLVSANRFSSHSAPGSW